MHIQVPAKVTAFVDQNIAELVNILNEYDGVASFSSCEGGLAEPAHVYFRYGKAEITECLEIADFANKLVDILSDIYDASISMRWEGDKKTPYLALTLPKDRINAVSKAMACHKNRFSHDNRYKEPHS